MLRFLYVVKHFAQGPGRLLKAFLVINRKVKELTHLLVSIPAYRTKQAGQHSL